MSASAPGSVIERTNAAMRPSSPRSSRISSTTARYSRSSSRVRAVGRLVVGALLDLDAQACRCGSVLGGAGDAAVQAARARRRGRRRAGGRGRSTSATVPTRRVLVLVRGTSSTRSSSPTSTVSVTFMLGKTTMSSRGTRSRLIEFSLTDSRFRRMSNAVVGSETVPTRARAASSAFVSPSTRRNRCERSAPRRGPASTVASDAETPHER